MPHHFSKLSKCKSHAHRRAKAEDRGASPRESTISCGHRSIAGRGHANAAMPVRFRLTAPFHVFVAETERHLSCKQVHVGANPTEGSSSNAFHGVIAAPLFVKETASGQNRLRSPNFKRAHGEVVEPVVCKSTQPGASPGRTSIFQSDTREPANSLALEARGARGSTGVSDHFHWSVA